MTKQQARIMLLVDEAKKGYGLYKDSFEQLEAGYLNILAPQMLKSLQRRRKSHITPQIIKAKVRRVAISVLRTYFENDEFARLSPEYTTEDTLNDVAVLQKRLDVWTTKKIVLYTRFKPAVIDALVYGTPIMKIYWGNGLKIQRIKVKDLWIDPNASSIFDIQYCVNRVRTTVGKLKRQFGKKIKWKNFVGQTDEGTQVSTVDIGDASRVEVLDVYRYQDGKWLLSTILPDQSFIRTDEELKDGLPFIIGNVDPQFIGISETNAVEAYGSSFIETMIPLQEEYTITRNQQIDAIDKTFNPQYLATKMSGLNEVDLMSGRKKVTVSSLQELEQVQLPRIDPSIFHTDRLDTEMQEVSGVTKATQGLVDNESKYQTATGMSILSEEGNAVIGDIIRALNESFFEPAIRRIVRLIYKYDECPDMFGMDRSKNVRFFVTINAGVGAVNNELMMNNLSAMFGSSLQMCNTAAQMQDLATAQKYLKVLDEIQAEQAKVLKLKTLIPILKGEYNNEQHEHGAGNDRIGGGGNLTEGYAGSTTGDEELGRVQDFSGGADAEIQQAL